MYYSFSGYHNGEFLYQKNDIIPVFIYNEGREYQYHRFIRQDDYEEFLKEIEECGYYPLPESSQISWPMEQPIKQF
jgi:hypothetical protein